MQIRSYGEAFLSVLLVSTSGLAEKEKPHESLAVHPALCLIDERVQITASGLKSGNKVVVRAAMTDVRGREWRSHAAFVADPKGNIDLSNQAPFEGTYQGVDGMGLLWSVRLPPDLPEERRDPNSFEVDFNKDLMTLFELEIDRQVVAKCELKRMMKDPRVTGREIKTEGLVGDLFLPPGKGPHPGLIILSGSDGGVKRSDAALLASHGFASFALGYFRAEGLPDNLVEIPLEYLKAGIDWLRKQEGIAGEKLGVIGGSRGGELALLLGATYPEIRCVVAYVPSHVVWQGLSAAGPPPDKSSWTLGGQPVPYLRGKPSPAFFVQFANPGKPMKLLDLFASALEDADAVKPAEIAVERIQGSVLLVSGKADQMWPSTLMAEQVIGRLRKNKHAFPFEHLSYEGAGHAIRKGYLPAAGTTATKQFELGGTEEANAKAQADSWPKVLRFLQENLE